MPAASTSARNDPRDSRSRSSCSGVQSAVQSWNSCSSRMVVLLDLERGGELSPAAVQVGLDGADGGAGLPGDLLDRQVGDVVQGDRLPDGVGEGLQRLQDGDPVDAGPLGAGRCPVPDVGTILGTLLAP